MLQQLCIHGHFYQPPRQDPWLGEVLPEGSAAPGLNWNERIGRESYAPLAHARLLGHEGKITGIVNAYEWMSFNFGPTLLSWLERHDPDTYARVLAADAASRARLGFGNAMAQVRHHVIMPLATEREKRIEVAWAVADFEARFSRSPDGMWLAETAVDTASLEALAEAGMAYTVLAPRQAAAVAGDGEDWRDVDEHGLDITTPYRVDLPSGRSIAVFFYHGGLSQAVAFERLLENGEAFWQRLRGALAPGLTSLATDGETYGHHFTFGEMALAYVLDQARQDPEVELTNYAASLAACPPVMRVRLHENSSWSCAHGVQRWRADCGCNTEGRDGWNQSWRGPLRQALRLVKDKLDTHFDTAGAELFADAGSALAAYGEVLAGATRDEFEAAHFAPGLDSVAERAWSLLEMQRFAQAAFASCAWFFDDLDRIEPLNAMSNMLRALDLAADTDLPGGAESLTERFVAALAKARSNPSRRHPSGASGDELFRAEVLPRRETPASLVAQALLRHWAATRGELTAQPVQADWPEAAVRLEFGQRSESHTASGTGSIATAGGRVVREIDWEWKPAAGTRVLDGRFRTDPDDEWFRAAELPWSKRQALALAWAEANEEAAWNRDLMAMQTGRDLFLEQAESQTDQNLAARWGRWRAALAWLWITAPRDGETLLESFLKAGSLGADEQAALNRRLTHHLLELLKDEAPDWDAAEVVVSRARELASGLDWWAVQNRVWTLKDLTPEASRLARLLDIEA